MLRENKSGSTRSGGSLNGSPLIAYVIFCVVLMSIPFVCMPFAGTDESSEKKDLASWPTAMVDGKVNLSYLGQAGRYFEDHFAFRNQMVDYDALLKERLLRTSATDRVVVGKSGWLFYDGTLNDYQRVNQMSDRGIFNAVHNMLLVQEYVTKRGGSFAVGIAPNKNSLYPTYMPSHLLPGEGAGNLDRFMSLSEDMGLNVMDLRSALGAQDGELYYKTDSHWTNDGARIGAQLLMRAVGHEMRDLGKTDTLSVEHMGDLATMLRPLTSRPEEDIAYRMAQEFVYVQGETVEDSTIVTSSSRLSATQSIVVYRDSFGNALVPYFASEYRSATFSKLMPFDIGIYARQHADAVIVERAERHLSSLATTPPYLFSMMRDDISEPKEVDDDWGKVVVSARINGPYLQIGGYVDDALLAENATILVSAWAGEKHVGTFECFLVSSQTEEVSDVDGAGEPGSDEVIGDGGFRAFLSAAALSEQLDAMNVRILVHDSEGCRCVQESFLPDVLVES